MPRETVSENQSRESSVIAGRNAVAEALKKGRPIDCIYILKGADRGSMGKIIALAKQAGVPIKDAAAQKLDTLCEGVVHQGVVAMAACHDSSTMEDIFQKAGDQPPFVIICDNIEDPHNLGAIIRTAEAAGAHGVIIPKRRGVADMDGQPWCSTDMGGPIGIVVGAEGSGVSRLTKEHCDFVVSLPMNGQVNSLNASVAAAIVIYEAVRQRSGLPSFVKMN